MTQTRKWQKRLDRVTRADGVMEELALNLSARQEDNLKEGLVTVFRGLSIAELAGNNENLQSGLHLDMSDEEIENTVLEEQRKPRRQRQDDVGVLFARETEYRDPRSFETKYKNLGRWRNIMPTLSFTPGTSELSWILMDMAGEVEVKASGDNSMVFSDVNADEYFQKVNAHKNGYRYTFSEMRKAALANRPLAEWKVKAVYKAFETDLQTTMFLGNSDLNLTGLFNDTNVPNAVAPNAAGGTNSPVWGVDKTPDEVISDITGLPADTISTYKGAFGDLGTQKFRIILPSSEMMYIMRTPRSINSDTSIYNWIRENFSDVIDGFDIVHEADTAGTSSSSLMMSYVNDSEVFEAHVADSIIWHAPQFHGYEMQIPAEMEYGGVEIRYPLTFNKMYGI